VSFSRLRHDPSGKLLDQCGTRLVCSYYVRCVKHPEILADVSVNHELETGAVKAIITRRDSSQSFQAPQGGTVAGLQPVPAAANWLRSSPRSKRMTRPCAGGAYFCSRAVSCNAGLTLWEPWTPGTEPTWPAQAFRRSAASTLCWPAYCAAISGALSTRPKNVDGVAWPDSKK